MPSNVAPESATLGSVEHRHHRLPVAVVVAVALIYAWWAAGLAPFTPLATVAVAAAAVAVTVVGRRRRRPSPAGIRVPCGALPWAVLFALLAGWELGAYLQHPRADHPTLSSLADQVLGGHPARALAFLVWMAVGADTARR